MRLVFSNKAGKAKVQLVDTPNAESESAPTEKEEVPPSKSPDPPETQNTSRPQRRRRPRVISLSEAPTTGASTATSSEVASKAPTARGRAAAANSKNAAAAKAAANTEAPPSAVALENGIIPSVEPAVTEVPLAVLVPRAAFAGNSLSSACSSSIPSHVGQAEKSQSTSPSVAIATVRPVETRTGLRSQTTPLSPTVSRQKPLADQSSSPKNADPEKERIKNAKEMKPPVKLGQTVDEEPIDQRKEEPEVTTSSKRMVTRGPKRTLRSAPAKKEIAENITSASTKAPTAAAPGLPGATILDQLLPANEERSRTPVTATGVSILDQLLPADPRPETPLSAGVSVLDKLLPSENYAQATPPGSAGLPSVDQRSQIKPTKSKQNLPALDALQSNTQLLLCLSKPLSNWSSSKSKRKMKR
ncbi:hypothetical protein COOONC_24403 [Cooperia oncophora]